MKTEIHSELSLDYDIHIVSSNLAAILLYFFYRNSSNASLLVILSLFKLIVDNSISGLEYTVAYLNDIFVVGRNKEIGPSSTTSSGTTSNI